MARPRNPEIGGRSEEIISMYLSGMTIDLVSKEIGCSQGGVFQILKKNGVIRRGRIKHEIDNGFFSVIDTPEKAYTIGMIATDGYVNERTNAVCISLKRDDRTVLVLIAASIGYRGPIVDYDKTTQNGVICTMSRLQIARKRLVEDLIRHGIHQNKGATIRPWLGPENLLPHYWRGCVDGDGSVLKLKTGSHCYTISFCGNEAMVLGFRDFIAGTLGIDGHVKWRNDKRSYKQGAVSYTKLAELKKIATLLYGNSGIAIRRKKDMADRIISDPGRGDLIWDSVPTERLIELHRECGNWTEVGRRLGMKSPSNASTLAIERGLKTAKPKGDLSSMTREVIEGSYARVGDWLLVAKEFGMTTSHLRRRAALVGVEVPKGRLHFTPFGKKKGSVL